MSEEGRSTFAEALTRFSITSEDFGSESVEENSEDLHLHGPKSLPLEEVEMIRTKSVSNVSKSNLEGKESQKFQ